MRLSLEALEDLDQSLLDLVGTEPVAVDIEADRVADISPGKQAEDVFERRPGQVDSSSEGKDPHLV